MTGRSSLDSLEWPLDGGQAERLKPSLPLCAVVVGAALRLGDVLGLWEYGPVNTIVIVIRRSPAMRRRA